ncbi:type VII secretion protein EsxI [Mycobacterium sherrisii]|uniref:type VII secretion protein EsxI n=1 Tax=Mycobacterium sherrisii TaxID=243061 RepID=UPI0021F38187|nr:type VII secretion protein EsxI [Mycobacterium sherrisii]MCV7031363.1 type VII secretion protein EsxI [Mycobacterium sherrisii]
MSINYQFGDVDAHGALIRAQAASLEAEHQAIVRDVLAAGIYEQANQHGQKVQTAGSNMASTDSAVGSSWA